MHFTKAELIAVLKVASRNSARRNINGVRFERDRIVATNGFVLVQIKAPEERRSEIDAPFTIDREQLERIIKVMGKDTVARVAASPDPFSPPVSRVITIDGTTFAVTQSDVEYAAYKKVVPKAFDSKITLRLNAQYLRDACDVAIKTGARRVGRGPDGAALVEIRIIDELSPISLKTVSIDGGEVFSVVMPLQK